MSTCFSQRDTTGVLQQATLIYTGRSRRKRRAVSTKVKPQRCQKAKKESGSSFLSKNSPSANTSGLYIHLNIFFLRVYIHLRYFTPPGARTPPMCSVLCVCIHLRCIYSLRWTYPTVHLFLRVYTGLHSGYSVGRMCTCSLASCSGVHTAPGQALLLEIQTRLQHLILRVNETSQYLYAARACERAYTWRHQPKGGNSRSRPG